MKIALVRARYNPYGGAERFTLRAMQALAQHGVELTVLARAWPVAQASAASLSLRWLRCDPFYLGSLWREWSFARAAQRALAQESFDLVQSHERIPGLDIYRAGDGVHAAWLERRNTLGSHWQAWRWRLNPYHRYLCRREREMFEHPELRAVICNSQMVRDEILQRFKIAPSKLHVIANGVDLEHFHPQVRESLGVDMRATLNIPSQATVFLFVGSGFERKGLASAIRALAQTRATAAAFLIVVGSDKRLKNYQNLAQQCAIAGQVRFVGARPDVLPYYAAADAFVLPTLYDPFPNAALEALACGLPVITSDASGVKEIVQPGINGWIAAAHDVGAFAQALRSVIDMQPDTQRILELRQAARLAAQPYGLNLLGERLIALYRQLSPVSLS